MNVRPLFSFNQNQNSNMYLTYPFLGRKSRRVWAGKKLLSRHIAEDKRVSGPGLLFVCKVRRLNLWRICVGFYLLSWRLQLAHKSYILNSLTPHSSYYAWYLLWIFHSEADADQIFKDAKLLNMTGSGYVWIVTEQALRSEYVPEGTLGLKLVKAEDERGHISDSL